MNKKFSQIISFATLFSLMLTTVPMGLAYAQDPLPPSIALSENSIPNNVSTILTVTGTSVTFDGSSKVVLDGSEVPGTVLVNETTLQVALPAGLGLGDHIVTVSGVAGVSATLNVFVPPTPEPPNTPEPPPFNRPQFVVVSSKVNGTMQTGGNVTLKVVIENVGQNTTAYSTQAVYTSSDLVPTKTGGVIALGDVKDNDQKDVSQTFYVSAEIYGSGIVVTDLTVSYYDEKGSSYADKFTISIPVNGTVYSGVAAATSTPTGVKSSQLVITSYKASVDPLQPGEQFTLTMTVQNVGNEKAQRVTMIVGGGSSGTSGGTPQPGGVSGGSGEFTNFAPVGASNVQSLGDVPAGGSVQAAQNLIVNVSTSPGAYPMKITFSYLNDKNEVINDEQVITLLVYSLPNVDVSFYRPPDPFFVGQPGALPIQVVNLGKRMVVLGNITVSAESGLVENGTGLVGSLEAGGYFTLDALFTPEQSGSQSLDVVIEYVDDFNEPRTIVKKLDLEVSDEFVEPTPDPSAVDSGGGGGDFVEEETTLHKYFRFIKGLFGLDSSWPVWQPPGGAGQMEESSPVMPAGKG
jgi:hypothetical protein